MKKFLALFLAILMLAMTLVGCKSEEQEEESTAGESDASTETANPYDVYDSLGDLKFGTAENPVEFSVIQWDSYDPDWCIDITMKDSSIVGQELYERQLYMEERFGIVFAFTEVKGRYSSITELNQKIEGSIMSGAKEYDLAGHYSVGASLNVTSGYAHNLLDVEYLDLSRSYWPADLLGANVINGQLYFLSGYLAPSYFGNIVAVGYNQGMIDNMSFENPVALVDGGAWTLGKMKEMAINLYDDSDNSNSVTEKDNFGIVLGNSGSPLDALVASAGVKIMDIGSDGKLQLSPSCYSTKAIGIVDTFTKLVTQNNAVYVHNNNDTYGDIFTEERTLFYIDQLNSIRNAISESDFGIGVVPLPKYDTDQQVYHSSIGYQYSMFTIPADAKDPNMSAALLEALEAYSYRELFPVLYEENFKIKYAKDEDMGRMVTLIYESVMLDPARTWGDAAALYWVMRASLIGAGDSWSTKLAANRDTTYKTSIDALNTYLFR